MGRLVPFLVLGAVQVAFASIAAAGKLALQGGVPPLALAGVRVLFAGVLLATLLLARRRAVTPDPRHLPALFGLALLGVVFNQVLFVLGLERTTAVNAQILITTIPVFTLIVAVLLRREHFDLSRALGVGVALTGTLVLLRVDRFAWQDDVVLGNLLIVLNALSYSFYLVLAARMIRTYGGLAMVTWVFLLSAIVVVPIGTPQLAEAASMGGFSTVGWFALAWIVLVPTVFAYAATNYTLKHFAPSTVGASVFLQPLLGVALALAVVPGERLTMRAVAAGVLILLGVVVVWLREVRSPTAGTGKPINENGVPRNRGRGDPQPQEGHP